MSEFANAMEVFKLLDKSNCRACNEATCLAFASKVFLGQKALGACPRLEGMETKLRSEAPERSDMGIPDLWEAVLALDWEDAAKRTGGRFKNNRLELRVLGKPLALTRDQSFVTDIHAKPWMNKPILEYVLHAKGKPLSGEWAAYRDLPGGREMEGLFIRRVHAPLKKVADAHPNLFGDLARLFSGRRTDGLQGADIALTLHPLPLLPVTLCYWKAEDGMDSDLVLLFDTSAGDNGGFDVAFRLSAGLARMFELLAETHGFVEVP